MRYWIDAPSVERWLAANAGPRLGVDTTRYTVFLVNWCGRSDFRFHVYDGRLLCLLASPYHKGDAACPGGKQINTGNSFKNQRRQKQPVEAKECGHDSHDNAVHYEIKKLRGRCKRTRRGGDGDWNLNHVGDCGNGKGQNNARFCEFGFWHNQLSDGFWFLIFFAMSEPTPVGMASLDCGCATGACSY